MGQDGSILTSIAERIGKAVGSTKDCRGWELKYLVFLSHLRVDNNVDEDAKGTQGDGDLP